MVTGMATFKYGSHTARERPKTVLRPLPSSTRTAAFCWAWPPTGGHWASWDLTHSSSCAETLTKAPVFPLPVGGSSPTPQTRGSGSQRCLLWAEWTPALHNPTSFSPSLGILKCSHSLEAKYYLVPSLRPKT